MGSQYSQLSMEERCYISLLRKEGASIRKIAANMDRSPSSVARELKRNITPSKLYKPDFAQLSAKSRRWSGSRLDRDHTLRDTVLDLLKRGLSPEQVSGRLALLNKQNIISYESIYRFIYAQIRRTNDFAWRHFLPQSKHKRGRRRLYASSPVLAIKDRVPIRQRPQEVFLRVQPGHWEADLMLFSKCGQALLAVQDRTSRLLIMSRQPGKSAQSVADRLLTIFSGLPPIFRRSITFDNGTEFAYHYQLHGIDMKTYFCDPYSPWQKGGIENAIGRMRRGLPRKTDIATLSLSSLQSRVAAYNHTPRKCLGFQTPAEVFAQQLLHFKCESTFQRSLE